MVLLSQLTHARYFLSQFIPRIISIPYVLITIKLAGNFIPLIYTPTFKHILLPELPQSPPIELIHIEVVMGLVRRLYVYTHFVVINECVAPV